MIKLASWNVNSIKVRLEQLSQWLNESQIDVVALQETKTIDDDFPHQVFADMGYQAVFSGQKTYNGVAIISRFGLEDVIKDFNHYLDPQRRILAATIRDIRLINLYVPNGSAVGSEKYQYKLLWLEHMLQFVREQLIQYPKLAVVGDFNIAPEDIDVHDPLLWEGNVLVSPLERAAFKSLLSLGLYDSFRTINPNSQEYSWWDYRAGSYRRNHGLRIDHILLSEALKNQCTQSKIESILRKADRPSDHAPVWVQI